MSLGGWSLDVGSCRFPARSSHEPWAIVRIVRAPRNRRRKKAKSELFVPCSTGGDGGHYQRRRRMFRRLTISFLFVVALISLQMARPAAQAPAATAAAATPESAAAFIG